MGGRIDVETDDVLEFLGKLRFVWQLERADAMQREPLGLQDTLHRAQAHPSGLRRPLAHHEINLAFGPVVNLFESRELWSFP